MTGYRLNPFDGGIGAIDRPNQRQIEFIEYTLVSAKNGDRKERTIHFHGSTS